MSSFTKPLTVTKVKNRIWRVEREFTYHIGSENGSESVTVKEGFETDFASVPRIFWRILPPDGQYTQAAVLHDFLYNQQLFPRKKCDGVFLEAMEVLEVPKWKRLMIYRAVRIFGWMYWSKKNVKRK